MINLVPTAEQREIAASVAEFLAAELPLSRFHGSGAPLREDERWAQMAELGFLGLGLPEAAGGVGYGLLEEMLVFREFGRFAVSPNALAAVLGAHAAVGVGDMEIAASLIDGASRASVATPLDHFREAPRLDSEHHLIDAEAADWLVVWSERGAGLIPRSEALEVTEAPSIDWTLSLARARFPSARPERWAGPSQAPVFQRAGVLLAASLVGLADAARDASVAYAKVREQFGQPIGAFQAVKHRCADMAVRCEAAWCLTLVAGLSQNFGQPDALFQIASARMVAADAALQNTAANIQNHGASGFTAELEAHILLKRARFMSQMGGDQQAHQKLLMRQPAPTR